MELETRDTNDGADFQAVQDGLEAYNRSVASDPGGRPLCVYARDAGVLVGGVCGITYWHWLLVGQIWVDEARRGEGIGRALMDALEAGAKKRGSSRVFLDTVTLQAPGFYEKLGYRVIGTQDDFPPGAQRLFMVKDL